MSKKLNPDRELVIQKYVVENKSIKQAAKELGCSKTTLSRYLKKYNIEKRDSYATRRKNVNFSKELLEKEYKIKSAEQISKEQGCGKTTILRYLKKFGIAKRGHSEILKEKFKGKNNPSFKYDITEDFLINEYEKNHKDSSKLAKVCDCSAPTILRNLKKYGIKTRTQKEAQKGLRMGPNNPNWIDGRSFLPYPPAFNKALKASIRKRDNYTCQVCGMTEEEHLIIFGTNLTIHHADYNKENCDESNLFSTCFTCNARVNFNKTYWLSFFQNKIGQTK
jgi:predicted transcriptional regulator